MIGRHSNNGYVKMLGGIRMKTINSGERMLMAEFLLAGGSVLPEHSHPHEQSGYLVSGRMRFHMEGKSYELGPGDNWSVPANVRHQVDVLEDCVVVEVFAPVREEYLKYLNQDDIRE
jgi:quercetin dioxygenase-like cupin family protein